MGNEVLDTTVFLHIMIKWFKKLKPLKPYNTLPPSQITFLGEQDGGPERNLKEKLSELFVRNNSVRQAYLARTSYSDPAVINVTLCINSTIEDDKKLVKYINEIFSQMFRTDAYLDIIFLKDDVEEKLKKVCAPFYDVE